MIFEKILKITQYEKAKLKESYVLNNIIWTYFRFYLKKEFYVQILQIDLLRIRDCHDRFTRRSSYVVEGNGHEELLLRTYRVLMKRICNMTWLIHVMILN